MSTADNNSSPKVPLSDLSSGERGLVCDLKGEPSQCSRLREMGFCEEAVVEKLSGKHTLLCHVCGTRVALNGQLAQNILVKKIA